MERLALGGISLCVVPLPVAGLAGLRSLSISHADVTDKAVKGVLANCVSLESLTFTSVASERLQALELVGCCTVRQAPGRHARARFADSRSTAGRFPTA